MSNIPKARIYLSRRNLLTLLAKLDHKAAGGETECAIVKYRQPSPKFQQTMTALTVIAVSDEMYYKAQQRSAGEMPDLDLQ